MRFALLGEDDWGSAANTYHARLDVGDTRPKAFRKAHEHLRRMASKASTRARAAYVPPEVQLVIAEFARRLGGDAAETLVEKLAGKAKGSPEVGRIRDEVSYALDAIFFDHRTIGAALCRDRSTISAGVSRHARRLRDDAEVSARMTEWLAARGRSLAARGRSVAA